MLIHLIASLQARLTGRDRGATAVEYGLIIALIAAVIVVVVALLGDNIREAFTTVNDCVEDATVCSTE